MSLAINTAEPTMPKQRRSRARRAAMIDHGVTLLNKRDLEDISIAEITGELGFSTGSFYSSFSDKTAFFVAVQTSVNEALDTRIDQAFVADTVTRLSLVERLELCVDFTLDYFRTNRGVIRSALRYEAKIPDAWAPNRRSAQRIIDAVTTGLASAERARMQVAIQLAFGTMVNALLHDPGPLRLDDDAFGTQVKAALAPYLTETNT